MKKVDLQYWIRLGLVTAVLSAVIAMVFVFLLPDQYPKILPWFLGLTVVITAAGQILIVWALQKQGNKFQSWYMIFKSVKMLIIMTFMLVYVFVSKSGGIPFLGSVFVIYLVYMIFESMEIKRAVREAAGN